MYWKIKQFDTVTSTNTILKELLLNNNASEGTVIVANTQTNGRGKGDKKWFSAKGKGIYFSILLKPDLPLNKLDDITLWIGKIICDFFKNLYNIDIYIKKPNDIMCNNKKLCGILTEGILKGERLLGIIIGIGINVNHSTNDFPDLLKDIATSLYILTNKKINNLNILLKQFLNYFESKYNLLIKEKKGINIKNG